MIQEPTKESYEAAMQIIHGPGGIMRHPDTKPILARDMAATIEAQYADLRAENTKLREHNLVREICEALGWQGGTVHQVIAQVKTMRGALDTIANTIDSCGGAHFNRLAKDALGGPVHHACNETNGVLREVRAEITRLNQAAGHTVFNPAITEQLESLIR